MKTLNIALCLASALTMSCAFANDVKLLTIADVMPNQPSASSTSARDDKSQHESTTKKDSHKTEHYLSDSAITAKVKEKFIQEKLFGKEKISAMRIHVKTRDGIVTLKGTVSSTEEADEAVKLAKSVEGVKAVNSKIKIKEAKK